MYDYYLLLMRKNAQQNYQLCNQEDNTPVDSNIKGSVQILMKAVIERVLYIQMFPDHSGNAFTSMYMHSDMEFLDVEWSDGSQVVSKQGDTFVKASDLKLECRSFPN